jgi:hypothetical protein
MKIKLSRTDIYIPNWNGNRSLPESEQVKIEYRFMTCEEEERFSLIRPIYNVSDGKTQEISINYEAHANDIWRTCVKKVNGLVDETGAEIIDPKKVAEIPGMYNLITEIVAEIKRGLTETDLKN